MTTANVMVRGAAPMPSWTIGRVNGARLQLTLGLLTAVVLPMLVAPLSSRQLSSSDVNSLIGATCGLALGLCLFRKLSIFPGVRSYSYILPSFASGYGVVVASFLLLRFDYSRIVLILSFVAALATFAMICVLSRRKKVHIHLIPGGRIGSLRMLPQVEWTTMRSPQLPDARGLTFAADLHSDLSGDWQRIISQAAIAGHAIYHYKDLQESLTGRVEIEHLSENRFGSLIPNLAYCKIKSMIDVVFAAILLPFLLIPLALVGLLIKLDSSGPIFFRQIRMGYRGKPFAVLKFRTMQHVVAGQEPESALRDAMTSHGDPRITRIGRFLRRSRIDELPQIFNILRREMSWIGPRPEAMPLSTWYEKELPFYSYRHIVRPGITGWAQVNQGHVADLDQVHFKLHYDFYYIKYFSAWLDGLILLRTLKVVLHGIGAK